MTSSCDGGPAFPIPPLVIGDSMWDDRASDGMSLRDWFAGQAVAGLMVLVAAGKHQLPEPHGSRGCAIEAYRLADAMLAERVKRADAPNGDTP